MDDLVIVEQIDYSQVVFDDVKECYPEDSDLLIHYSLNELLKADQSDFIGIYKVQSEINIVFIRFLRHVLIEDECSAIRTCSYYIETQGDFWFYDVFLKSKRANFWLVSQNASKVPKIDTL